MTESKASQSSTSSRSGCGCCGGGVFGSVGAVVAVLLSWQVNGSFLWALIHGCLSWFYVIYHLLRYGWSL